MTRFNKGIIFAVLLLFGAAGCADLAVDNPNAADRDRALSTAGDVESLIGGAFAQHFQSLTSYYGPNLFLSTQSFEHQASWNNACMVPCAAIPRQTLQNAKSWSYYGNIERVWARNYRALAAVADGLRTLENNQAIADELGAENVGRLRAFGRFVQGLAHGAIATFYDQGFIVDETTDVENLGDPVDYNAMMAAALGYLDEAISLAGSAGWSEIPAVWANKPMTPEQLAQRANTYKARFRAAVARTPAEREAVDWQAVIDELDAGVDEWFYSYDYSNWYNSYIDYGNWPGWAWMDYMVFGMADQSGDVQAWWDTPVGDRMPEIGGEPVMIETPDTRFPQGATIEDQVANPGSVIEVATTSVHSSISEIWAKPDRGTWRWSWYRFWDHDATIFDFADVPEVRADEIRLLKAEAYYRLGDTDMAADLVNVTREAAGLNATDGSGTNTSCVPKLPNGDCGDLLEMIKWEKRLETRMVGLFGVGQYLDGRGWGDLYKNTQTQFAVPCGEMQILQIECKNMGGGEDYSAPTSVYTWPHEG